jgi:hypothetical protein
MSVDQARALMRRMTADPDFAARLRDTPIEEKRGVLVAEGYGDVKLTHISQALPESRGGELTDEEFASVVGAGDTTTIVSAASGPAESVVSVAAASAAMGAT